MKYNGNVYYFQKNLQGDIIRILNTQGSIVATYTYDAWGNIIASTDTSGVSIGTKNPFRYRGYYYDTETGLYYLNSRYYDPQVGRFLNADAILGANGDLMSYNMYSYCSGNPVNYSDSSGMICVYRNSADASSYHISETDAKTNNQSNPDDIKDSNDNKVKKWLKKKAEKIGNAFLSSIEGEITTGLGVELTVQDVGLGYNNNVFFELDDNEINVGHSSSISLGPLQYTAKHYSEKNGQRIICPHCDESYKTGIEYMFCPHSESSFSVSIGILSIDSGGNVVIPLSTSGYAIVGGGVGIGFNLTDFFVEVFS